MLASLIIVFREVLEAGLIIGLVLAATWGVPGRGRWIGLGVAGGLAGACIVALFAESLSNGFAGSGQELFNAAVLGAAVLMLAWHNIWMASHGRALAAEMRAVGAAVAQGERPLHALALVVGAAVLREGAEVVLFLAGIAAGEEDGGTGMLLGGLGGIALGGGVALLLYAGLMRIPAARLFSVTTWLITLLAAGMASQAVLYLSQAGVIPFGGAVLWDSSAFLRDDGLLGRTLHVLVGYTDRPTDLQAAAWLLVAGTITALGRRVRA
jgi:high-affinity iron transporter